MADKCAKCGAEADWLVWSDKWNAWYRPGSAGYTIYVSEAGRWCKKHADEIAGVEYLHATTLDAAWEWAEKRNPDTAKLRRQLAAKDAELARVRRALAPFIREAQAQIDISDFMDDAIWSPYAKVGLTVTIAELRQAAEAAREKK